MTRRSSRIRTHRRGARARPQMRRMNSSSSRQARRQTRRSQLRRCPLNGVRSWFLRRGWPGDLAGAGASVRRCMRGVLAAGHMVVRICGERSSA